MWLSTKVTTQTSNNVAMACLHCMSASLSHGLRSHVVHVHVQCLPLVPDVDDVWCPGPIESSRGAMHSVPDASRSCLHVAVTCIESHVHRCLPVLGALHWSRCSPTVVPRSLPVAVDVCLDPWCHHDVCLTNPRGRKSEHWEKSYRSHGWDVLHIYIFA